MVDRARRLVFVSTRFLFPADSGGKIRTTQILRGLHGGRFHVTLVMPVPAESIASYSADISSVCDKLVSWEERSQTGPILTLRRVAQLLSSLPVAVASDFSSAGCDAVVRALSDSPDLVIFDFPHSAVLRPESLDGPTVMFTHNVETEIFDRHRKNAESWLMRRVWDNQYRKMLRFERDALASFDAVITVSERDRHFFQESWKVGNCRAIPTGVDIAYFSYVRPTSSRQVVFCGSMDWIANVDAIEFFHDNVWPLVRERISGARMKVVGRSPPSSLERRISRASPDWEFTGFVDDVRDHVCGSGVFVIPLRVGGGTRIKAFEAMAMGCPVVSTTVGIEGLPVEHYKHYLRADNPDEMADRIAELLNDAKRRDSMSSAARRLVETEFDYVNAARAFEQICLDVLDTTVEPAIPDSPECHLSAIDRPRAAQRD